VTRRRACALALILGVVLGSAGGRHASGTEREPATPSQPRPPTITLQPPADHLIEQRLLGIYAQLDGLQWPCWDETHPGSKFLHDRLWDDDPAKRGRLAPFSVVHHEGPLEVPDEEYPFTLTNNWQEYSVSLAGVTYNSYAEGVASGFFWKVAPPTPAGGAVTFFIDDIQFVQ
jgi:hypothetical protein